MFEKETGSTAIKIGFFTILVLGGAVAFWGTMYNFVLPKNGIFSEINYKTEPTVTAPLKEAGTEKRFENFPTISQTNVLARDFVDLYLQAREENPDQEISTNERGAIANSLATISQEKYLQLTDPYITEDLSIQKTETIERLTIYFDAFGRIFGDTFPAEGGANEGPKELLIFFASIGSEDFTQLELLDPYIARYEQTTERVLALKVPEQFADFHLAAANTFANTTLALNHMKNYAQDPVGGLFGANQFSNEVIDFILSLGEIRDTLTELNLPFVENSDGELFEKYLQTI